MSLRHSTLEGEPKLPRDDRYTRLLQRGVDIVHGLSSASECALAMAGDALLVGVNESTSMEQREKIGKVLALSLGVDTRVAGYGVVPHPHQMSIADDPNALVVPRAAYVVVSERPFSNIYEAIPQDMLARIYAHVLSGESPVAGGGNPKVARAIRDVLAQFSITADEVKVLSYDGFTQVLLDAAPDIIEEGLFYDLASELQAGLGPGHPLVIMIAPRPPVSIETITEGGKSVPQETAPGPQAGELVLPAPVCVQERIHVSPEALQEVILSQVGTSLPVRVVPKQNGTGYSIQLLRTQTISGAVVKAQSLLSGVFAVIGDPVTVDPVTVEVIRPEGSCLIRNQGRRKKITREDLKNMARGVRRQLLLSDQARWADVSPSRSDARAIGTCVEIFPKVRISGLLLQRIEEIAKFIPAPVLIHNPTSPTSPLSSADVKALTHLMMSSAAIVRDVRVTSGGKRMRVLIQSSDQEWNKCVDSLATITTFMRAASQEIAFDRYPAEPGACIGARAFSRHNRRHFLEQSDATGNISVSSWKPPAQNSLRLPRRTLLEWRTTHPALIDYTELPVSLWDIEGTRRAEDGQSFVVRGNILRHGIHIVNAAIQVEPFSAERDAAYRHGDSTYISNVRSTVTHTMLPGLGGRTFQLGSASPAFSLFIEYDLNALDDPAAVRRSLAEARLEAALIRPNAVIQYPRRVDQKWELRLPKTAREELDMIKRVAGALQLEALGRGVSEMFGPGQTLGDSLSAIIRNSNHLFAKYLVASNLPCVYQTSMYPMIEEIQRCLNAIRASAKDEPAVAFFVGLSPEVIIESPPLLSRLHTAVRGLSSMQRTEIQLPPTREGVSLEPGENPLYGYSPYVTFNTGFRRVISLIAQHQLSAHFGLLDPLSIGEIRNLVGLCEEQITAPDKVAHDLRVSSVMEYLHQSRGKALFVTAKSKPRNGRVKVQLHHAGSWLVNCVATIESGDARLSTIKEGDPLKVIASHYDMTKHTFMFRLE